MVCSIFFVKQKTAYEMRISDWSSDVCSSDLAVLDEAEDDLACPDRALEHSGDREQEDDELIEHRRRPRIAVDQPYRDHDDEEAGRLRDRLADDRDPAPGGAIGIAQFAAEPAQGIERGDDGGGDARRDQDLEPVRLNPVYRIAHEFMRARAAIGNRDRNR